MKDLLSKFLFVKMKHFEEHINFSLSFCGHFLIKNYKNVHLINGSMCLIYLRHYNM